MKVIRPGTRSGLSCSHRAMASAPVADGPSLQARGLPTPRRNSTWAPSRAAGALADPEEVGRAVVPVVGEAVLAGEGFLPPEDEGLVAGVHVDLVELRGAVEVDAAGLHEGQRPLDLRRHLLVALPLGAGGHELLRPGVDAAEVGKPALGEGPEQVQGGRRLVVRLHQALRVGDAGGVGGGGVVHDVAAEAGQVAVADPLGGRGAGLGELAGDAPHLHHGHAEGVGEDHGHLQDDPQLLPDVDGGERLEALGAVARLEEERLAVGHLGQAGGEVAGLAGEHQRGIGRDLLQGPIEGGIVRPFGLLLGREFVPGRRVPRVHHGIQRGRRRHQAQRDNHARPLSKLGTGGARSTRPERGAAAATSGGGDRCGGSGGAQPGGGERPLWLPEGGQAARILAASSRRPATARLTRRRAASAVTPSFSPTSRKLRRWPSRRPKRASTA